MAATAQLSGRERTARSADPVAVRELTADTAFALLEVSHSTVSQISGFLLSTLHLHVCYRFFIAECLNPDSDGISLSVIDTGSRSSSDHELLWNVPVDVYDNHIIYDLGETYLLQNVEITLTRGNDANSNDIPDTDTYFHFSSADDVSSDFETYRTQSGE